MVNTLEAIQHTAYRCSIKDYENDIAIQQLKWDFLFDALLGATKVVYFSGFRFNYPDTELDSNINYLSKKNSTKTG